MKNILPFLEDDVEPVDEFDEPNSLNFEDQLVVVFEFFEHLFRESAYNREPQSVWFENFREWIIDNNYRSELTKIDEARFYEIHASEFRIDLCLGVV